MNVKNIVFTNLIAICAQLFKAAQKNLNNFVKNTSEELKINELQVFLFYMKHFKNTI